MKTEEWVSVFSSGTDYEADLVRSRLDDSGIPAVVLTQRDHALNLTVGDLARVHVRVPPEKEAEARALLLEAPLTGRELDEAALAADPRAPDAHTPAQQARLDSGIDRIEMTSDDSQDDNSPDD
ncbi:MAG: hypothetical protein HKN43_09100 [Rhodothermales bacterium]|nr:hypothetical protein [Rhodothermales bacterium]